MNPFTFFFDSIRAVSCKYPKRNRSRYSIAALPGVAQQTSKRYVKSSRQGQLRCPIATGVRTFDISSYIGQCKAILGWAKHIEHVAKINGAGLTWASFGAEALKDKPYHDLAAARLETEKEEAKKKKEEAARLVKEEADLLSKIVQDIAVSSREQNVPDSEAPTGAAALLNAIGMGDSQSEDKLQQRATCEL